MNQPKSVSETELFFRQWLRSPKAIGSVKPSSRALARAVAAEVAWRPGQTVIELGGGTGAITQGLIDHGLPRESLLVVEIDAPMCEFLRHRLPGVKVVNGDATRLDEILQEHGIKDVGTVICGIPMVGMPLDFQRKIMDQCFRAGPAGGSVIQFSYSPVSPIKSKQLGIEARVARFVPLNLPPAFVWRFTRKAGAGKADDHR